MKKPKKHFRFVCRLLELKQLKLEKGGLSIDKQIEYDRVSHQITSSSKSACKKIKAVIKKIGYNYENQS
jgi:hypothetical protein